MYSDSTERIKDTEKENNESVTVDARRVKVLGKVHRNDNLVELCLEGFFF